MRWWSHTGSYPYGEKCRWCVCIASPAQETKVHTVRHETLGKETLPLLVPSSPIRWQFTRPYP